MNPNERIDDTQNKQKIPNGFYQQKDILRYSWNEKENKVNY